MINKLRNRVSRIGRFSKPGFIIIGAQKAGTSALYGILKDHRYLSASLKKEVNYFNNDQWYFQNGSIHEYHKKFVIPFFAPKHTICFEASPEYLYYKTVPERIYNYNKNMKFIVLLRNPAFRALSAWTMYHHKFANGPYSHLHDKRTFREAIEEEINNIDSEKFFLSRIAYVKRGIYHQQIERYYKYFDPSNFLIIESSKLKTEFKSVVVQITDFLSVPYQELEFKIRNQSEVSFESLYKDEIKYLQKFYRPHNQSLYKLLGTSSDWDAENV